MAQNERTGEHIRIYRLSAYPKEIRLLDGTSVTLRPMVPEDEAELLRFFTLLPEEDRRYLKEDVTSPEVIGRWAHQLDYNRALPLLAIRNGRIIGNATLHRRRSIARSHVGEVRVVVAAVYRTHGLGVAMLRELIAIAVNAGLERLVFELVAEKQQQAIEAAERLGFVRVANLPLHVKDETGKPHDLIILELPLGKWTEWWQF
jgi:L-amino acid N-acyltransferase YncA